MPTLTTLKNSSRLKVLVQSSDLYGFIGRNGAGKTTFLKMISGLSTPTSGDISLLGYSGQERKKILSRIGVLIEAPGLYPNMSAYDNLKLKCICVGIKKDGYIESILKTVGLDTVGKKNVKNFSVGMKQRLGIGMALVGEPDLLALVNFNESSNFILYLGTQLLLHIAFGAVMICLITILKSAVASMLIGILISAGIMQIVDTIINSLLHGSKGHFSIMYYITSGNIAALSVNSAMVDYIRALLVGMIFLVFASCVSMVITQTRDVD